MRAACLLVLLVGCSSSPATDAGMDARGRDGASDLVEIAPAVTALRNAPTDLPLTWTLSAPAPTAQLHVFATIGGVEQDVTTQAAFVTSGGVAAVARDGTVTATAPGHGTIRAEFGGMNATSTVEVNVSGTVVVAGSPDAPTQIDSAHDVTDPALLPQIEYPLDTVMIPSNLAPIEAQWAQATTASAFRVRWVSPGADVSFYTNAHELLFPSTAWSMLLRASQGSRASLTVTALSADATSRESTAPIAIDVASTGFTPALIYYWEASSSSLKVIDPTAGTNTLLRGDCSGCHALSRDGARVAFVREAHISGQPTYDGLGALRHNAHTNAWDVAFAPSDSDFVAHTAVFGDWAGFGGESTGTTVMVTAEYDGTLPYHWHLDLRDPDTGARVPSDFSMLTTRARPGQTTLFETPELSADATELLASGGDNPTDGGYVTNPGIYAADITHDATGYHSTNIRPLVMPPDGHASELFPHQSADGVALLGLEVDGPYFVLPSTSRLFVLPDWRHGSPRVTLARASGAATDFPTWPQWAPDQGATRWIVFSTSRRYGHRGPGASPCGGYPIPCRQLWISAVDTSTAPSADPSHAPFWLPAQDVTTHNLGAQWTPPPPPM